MSKEYDSDDQTIVDKLDNIENILRSISFKIENNKKVEGSYKCRCGAIINGHEHVKQHMILGCEADYEKIKHMLIYSV